MDMEKILFNYEYSKGEYAYLFERGEIVKILSSTSLKNKTDIDTMNVTVVSLKDYDSFTGKPNKIYKCNKYALCPILDEDVQMMFKVLFNSKKFTILKNLS